MCACIHTCINHIHSYIHTYVHKIIHTNNYRPVTISSTLSKLLEVYILEVCGHHDFSDLQFGFITGRGTNMAVSLVNDVISYCTERGSPVYTCSLDAQGAFDAIPHAVLFRKAMDVLPDHCWMIIVNWYRAICVQIKWGSALSEPISVHKGTRQGRLSSPFLFNLFYQYLINELSECTCDWLYYYKQAVFQCILLRRRSDASKPNCYRSTNNDTCC